MHSKRKTLQWNSRACVHIEINEENVLCTIKRRETNKLIFIIKNILYCINNNSTNIILQISFDVLPKLSKQF